MRLAIFKVLNPWSLEFFWAKINDPSHVLSYEHFKIVLGLCGKGFDPRKSSVIVYATKEKCVKLWGPHKGHNGCKWKVDGNPLEIEVRIKKLNNVIKEAKKIVQFF